MTAIPAKTRSATLPNSKATASTPAARAKLLARLRAAVFARDPEFTAAANSLDAPSLPLVDFLFATADDPKTPDAVFDRLRWGGQFVYVSPDRDAVVEVERRFNHRGGFVIEQHPATHTPTFLGIRLPFLSRPLHYVTARKTLLVRPGESTDRFTYHVELIRHPQFGPDYVVMKQVPTFDRVVSRLREKFPDSPMDVLRRRAKKFTEKIFPVFLTREAGMLKILQERLPETHRHRVPRIIGLEKDQFGFVRTLYINWLRNAAPAGKPLTQFAFAKQAAELLHALHDTAGIIHLDLRLDNVVVTCDGVGFVDFGSAVKVGESFPESSLLASLFEEMMRTSQIQRMLSKMEDAGEVTSRNITQARHKVDKAVDFFYLAVQINSPHANPDLADLVLHEPDSPEARALAALTEEILRPSNVDHCTFKSAKDILDGLHRIEEQFHPAPPA